MADCVETCRHAVGAVDDEFGIVRDLEGYDVARVLHDHRAVQVVALIETKHLLRRVVLGACRSGTSSRTFVTARTSGEGEFLDDQFLLVIVPGRNAATPMASNSRVWCRDRVKRNGLRFRCAVVPLCRVAGRSLAKTSHLCGQAISVGNYWSNGVLRLLLPTPPGPILDPVAATAHLTPTT